MRKKIALALTLFLSGSASFADAEGNARLYNFGITSCQASAKLVSGYAEWLGNLKKLVNEDIALHPENLAADLKLLKDNNEKSKDILYGNFAKVNDALRASSDIKGLVKDLSDLLTGQAEALALNEPGMSRTYYQRSLDGFCSETMASIYSKLP